ncbi:tetratricopeptide repeat protein [Thiomicrorhabdus xiamenensis]|uniref:Tetratricopeptide repeat protein n=1 Tax=Thiomicrorhabdus xiamenensis TaxID=2739063 RepID=A0A7D4NKY7_9GAMM|nr:tetratricopeptide repeat protein [Thiomicrorhabdus xiamenensis]QKI88734.1 tetratricopeptide repeat protein [Thiomicrorhabdus xiamenensis]
MSQGYVFEVNQQKFNELVLLNSHKVPVIVEFLGVYSGPCITLEQELTELAHYYAGQFIFAKVDIDEQPELAQEYEITNLPTIKVFKDGKLIRTEEGKMAKEEQLEMLKSLGISRASDELREQARAKHSTGDFAGAIQLLTQAIQADPGNTQVALDMVQVMLDIDEVEEAKALFNRLPEKDRASDTGRTIIGQITFKELAAKTDGRDALLARLDKDPLDFDAYFDLSICLVTEYDYQGALESLFAIFDQNPNYKDGAAREMISYLLSNLSQSEPELVKKYRTRMGNAVA